MKKVFLLLISVVVLHADFTEKLSLNLRATYVDHNYDNYWDDSNAFASAIKLKYNDGLLPNLNFGIAFGAIIDFGLSDESKQSTTYIFDRDTDSFALLHQIYLQYTLANARLTVGRFEYSSPLIDSDDYFLLSNSFEGFVLESNFNQLNLQLGHISKMSGTWDAGYDGGKFISMSKSPWMHKADNQESSQWLNPVNDFNIKEKGITFVGITLENEFYALALWDYYAYEFFNSIYTQLDFKISDFEFALQYNTFDAIGQLKNNSNPSAEINYEVWGAKIATKIQDTKLTLAYNGVSDDSSAHLWGSYGGYPYFASGMMVTYFETSLRDSDIYSFNIDKTFIRNLDTTFHIGYYDLNKKYTIDTSEDRDAINGEDYMYTYGVANTYSFNKQSSLTLNIAGRRLQTGNTSKLFQALLKYRF